MEIKSSDDLINHPLKPNSFDTNACYLYKFLVESNISCRLYEEPNNPNRIRQYVFLRGTNGSVTLTVNFIYGRSIKIPISLVHKGIRL